MTDTAESSNTAARLAVIKTYHQRTKHRLERYAPGPETLDWSAQPDPFRTFGGAPSIALPLAADGLETPFHALAQPGAVDPRPFSLESLGILLELSFGLSAWKEYGPDRWALRCNPSSGNLHPTEAYLLCEGVDEIADGVYHYVSRDHLLERRLTAAPAEPAVSPRIFVGISSIHWREAWKYGERAFRYCQLDTGHAIGALRYAAAALGWHVEIVKNIGWNELGSLLGLDRSTDFGGAERDDPELLFEVFADPDGAQSGLPDWTGEVESWAGRANVLDRHPMYHWPIIDEVAESTRVPHGVSEPANIPAEPVAYPSLADVCEQPAAEIIRQRRSAQSFDRRETLSGHAFYRMLDALLPRADAAPWDVWKDCPARIHPVLMVHRVEGVAPGIYALPRNAAAETSLRAALSGEFGWAKPDGCPAHLPLFRLAEADCTKISRTINCHQAIGADSAFALGMLAEFAAPLDKAPWLYRNLYWEAGLLGQVLYLEAEAEGVRGTGIGCYFDDVFHELLGLKRQEFQSLYHFTVGFPITDSRILTLPPYAGRETSPPITKPDV